MTNRRISLGARRKLKDVTRRGIQAVLPSGFRSHIKASIREAFLAFESLLDEAVKSLEKEGRKEPGKKTGKSKSSS